VDYKIIFFCTHYYIKKENKKKHQTTTFLLVFLSQDALKSSFISPDFSFSAGDYYIKIEAGWDFAEYVPTNQKYSVKVSFSNDPYREAEYNDSPDAAKPLKSDTGYTGSLCQSSDKDYYEFVTNTNGTFSFDFAFNAEDVSYGWTVRIFDANMKELSTYKQIRSQLKTQPFKLGKGIYFIQIVAGWDYSDYYPANVPYKITLNSHETEINDTAEKANILTLARNSSAKAIGTVTGVLDSKKDVDYYKVTVPFASATEITISSAKKEARTVTIYTQKKTKTAAFAQIEATASKTVTLTPGIYYIVVASNGNAYSKSAYTIRVESNKN
jgi:hypothetical protein